MSRPDQEARDDWRKRGVEIVPYDKHDELLGFFEEMQELSEKKYATRVVVPASQESEINYDGLLESLRRAQKIEERYDIIREQLGRLSTERQRESFLIQLLALSRKHDAARVSPHLVDLATANSERVLLALMRTTEEEDLWNSIAPHDKHVRCREWAEHGIDLWDAFVALLSRITTLKRQELL
jgi:hypothetical protein